MSEVNIKIIRDGSKTRFEVKSPQGFYRLDDREALVATLDYLIPLKDKPHE